MWIVRNSIAADGVGDSISRAFVFRPIICCPLSLVIIYCCVLGSRGSLYLLPLQGFVVGRHAIIADGSFDLLGRSETQPSSYSDFG